MPDGKDLIYEGIATRQVHFEISFLVIDGKDLIYEGIATALNASLKRPATLTEKT